MCSLILYKLTINNFIVTIKLLMSSTHRAACSVTVLIITASHQTFSGQFWCLSGQNKFDLTHLLYIINGKVSVFLVDQVMSGQISTLIISTGFRYNDTRNYPKCLMVIDGCLLEY